MLTFKLLRVGLVLACFLAETFPVLALTSDFPVVSLWFSPLFSDPSGSGNGPVNAAVASSLDRGGGVGTFLFPAFQFLQVSRDESPVQPSLSLSRPSGKLLENFFQPRVQSWFDEASDSLSTVPTVMAAGSGAELGGRSIVDLRADSWQCSPKTSNGPKTQANNGRFQVLLKGCEVAEFPTKGEADRFSKAIRQALKTPDVDFSQLKPGFDGGNPSVKLGSQVLYVVNPELAQTLDRNAELLAIEWTNHMRVALGQVEFELAQAQAKMYELEDTRDVIDGVASWYGPYFHGRITATGEVYNQYDLTAASRTLPFDTYLRVTSRKNGKSVIVRINDRGPYVDEHLRILDLSYRAATCLGSDESGIVPIDAVILKPAPGSKLRIGQTVMGAAL